MKKSLAVNAKRRGQGMTEYIIIVALIAIAAIAVITLFGDNLRQLFGGSADALAGNADMKESLNTANSSVKQKNLNGQTFAKGAATY